MVICAAGLVAGRRSTVSRALLTGGRMMILSGDRVESAVQELVRLSRRRRARRGEALCTHRRPVLPGSAHASDVLASSPRTA
eukprot:scaffold7390_cov30-Phaeocystis_antarctica.AAC.1